MGKMKELHIDIMNEAMEGRAVPLTHAQSRLVYESICEFISRRTPVDEYVAERYASQEQSFRDKKLVSVEERVEIMTAILEVLGDPQFTHDCECCTFLGRYMGDSLHGYDLYYCTQGGSSPTVIARYGYDAPDYTSGMLAEMPELAEARRRAVILGLI